MSLKPKPTGLYRSILLEALRLTWKRKAVWVFGLFAGLISTGGVIDMALHSFERVVHQGTLFQQLIDESFAGYDLFARVIQFMYALGVGRTSWILSLCTLLVMGLIAAGVVGQISLLINSRSINPIHPFALSREARKHFWDVFVIDALTKLFSAVLIMITSLPFVLYLLEASTRSFWYVFFDTLLFLPLIIIVNILSLLALIDCVDNGSRPLDAIHTALRLFKKQWVATFEFGLALFLSVLLLGIIGITLGGILMIPYAIVYTTTLLSGSASFFFVTNVVFGVCILGIILAFAGAIVTFQYTAWHRFYKRGMHKQHGKKHISKIARWLNLS